MSVECRGWKTQHQAEQLVEVEIAYQGAFHFPARYSICSECVKRLEEWVASLRAAYGYGAVRFRVGPISDQMRRTRT